MPPPPLTLCRSLLFLPASNPRAIAKARTLEADMVILDLEDAVRPEDKDAARKAAVEAAGEGFGDRLVAIRVNGLGTPWHAQDMRALAGSGAEFVVAPKVERGEQAQAILGSAGEKPLIAMIETPAGVLAAPAIAEACAGLLVGTNDLRAALGIPPAADRAGLAYGLQAIVLAARAAGAAVFDGVYNLLDDYAGLSEECAEGRAFGFDGKSVIHPGQLATTNRLFSPGADEIAAAERLIASARGGAERFEGRMIEAMHVAEAERVLAKARQKVGHPLPLAGEAGAGE